MKAMKKIFVAILALTMVITGISYSKMDASEVKAAETDVNMDMLDVKVQVATNNAQVMRFISTVDSLDYSSVGFEVTAEGETTPKTYTTSTVYERIDSNTEGVEYTFSPKVVDTKSEYFVTAKMNVETGNYIVRAFVTTLDDAETKIYGESRCVALSDGTTANQINTSIDVANNGTLSTGAGAYTASYTNAVGTEVTGVAVTVLTSEAGHANVRLTDADTNLKSATLITIKDSAGNAVGTTIYRNLYTTYTGTADTSWYDVYLAANPNETEFVIATSADLYGVQAKGVNFSGKTIYLVSDIRVNEGKPVLGTDNATVTWYAYNEDGTLSTETVTGQRAWTSIGSTSAPFAGTFDGCMHTISGISQSRGTWNYQGLFAATAAGSTIQNLKLTDSSFKNARWNAALVGFAKGGTIDTVYSDAVVVGSSWGIAGIAGGIDGTVTIKNSWFDGNVVCSNTATGGIVGSMNSGTVTLENCLNSGSVTSTNTGTYVKVAGLVGDAGKCTVNITSCLNTGTITATNGTSVSAAIVGYINSNGVVNCEYSYGYFADNTVGYINGGKFYVTYLYNGEVTEKADNSAAGKYENVNIISQWKHNNNQFIGSNAEKNLGGLDFDTYWVTVENDTPILAAFDETEASVDTSWVNDTKGTVDDPYIISNKADLYGLAVLSETDSFEGKYIKVVDDIVVNTGSAGTWANSAPTYVWTPIGVKTAFKGNFDGGMHTISGIYLNTDVAEGGLFGEVTGTVKNLKLTNSYFQSTKNGMGSVIGFANGATLHTVCSDAIVVGSAWGTGGLVGKMAGNVNMDICWFGGTVTSSADTLGGLVGSVTTGTLNLTNCLNSGTVTCTKNTTTRVKTAGLVGDVGGNTAIITSCLNVGNITTNDKYEASIIGYLNSGGTANIITSYGLSDGTDENEEYKGAWYIIGYVSDGATVMRQYYKNGELTGLESVTLNDDGSMSSNSLTLDRDPAKMLGENAKTNLLGLDFENIWSVVTDSTPILSAFK